MDRRSRRLDRRSRSSFQATAPAALLVLGLALVLYGAPVPRLSEELYLPLVRHTGDAAFLAGDWTMRGPFGEHWVFDHAFGPLAAALPLAAFGWIGRLVSWSILSALLIRLGGRVGLRPVPAAAGIGLWLIGNQSLIGSDWMFGTFEAKTVAYCILVGALLAATRARVALAMALLGLTLSLHPGIGVWAAAAGSITLLLDPRTRSAAFRWSWLGVLFAAPGLIGLLATLHTSSNELQRFVVLHAIPHHADPFFGGARLATAQVAVRALTLVGMLIANVVWYRRSTRSQPARFLIVFQLILFVPVVGAFMARAFDVWSLLLLQPLRLGPVIIPLLFFWQLVRRVLHLHHNEGGKPSKWRRPSVRLAAFGFVLALVVTSPVIAAPRMASRSLHAWLDNDDEATAFAWIRDHTPTSTRCVVPIDRQDAFAIAERPIVGNWQAIRYDALGAWKRRVDALAGGTAIMEHPPAAPDELTALRAAYNQLTERQISAVAKRYHANCIVATTRYALPIWHRTNGVRIYRVDHRPLNNRARGTTVP